MPSPNTTNKTRIVSFRLTETEYAKLARYATIANMRVNNLARKLTLSKAEHLTIKAHRHDPALVKQLYHIGINLNQLVKSAHIFGRIPPQIKRICARIEVLMNEAIGKENHQ